MAAKRKTPARKKPSHRSLEKARLLEMTVLCFFGVPNNVSQQTVVKKLKLEEFAYPALSAAGIGEKNTISDGPDDGTLNCCTSHF